MAEIRIDAAKAERMIAQILRDEKRFFPADANALAANICRRLTTAMPTPTNPPLQGDRIIPWHPPDGGSEFIAALKKRIADVNYELARELWQLVMIAVAIYLQRSPIHNLGPLQRAFQWERLGVVSPQLEMFFSFVFDNSDNRTNHVA